MNDEIKDNESELKNDAEILPEIPKVESPISPVEEPIHPEQVASTPTLRVVRTEKPKSLNPRLDAFEYRESQKKANQK